MGEGPREQGDDVALEEQGRGGEDAGDEGEPGGNIQEVAPQAERSRRSALRRTDLAQAKMAAGSSHGMKI